MGNRDDILNDSLNDEGEAISKFGFGESKPVEIGSNTPIMLDDAETVLFIYDGTVDVFAVRKRTAVMVGSRRHLFRAHTGDMLVGLDLHDYSANIAIIAVGANQTQVARLPRARLEELLRDPDYDLEAIALLDKWIANLSSAAESVTALRQFVLLVANKNIDLKPTQITRPVRNILWVKCLSGSAQFLSKPELPLITDDDFLPISPETWLSSARGASLYAVDTPAFLREAFAWEYIKNFHRSILNCVVWNVERDEDVERERLKKRSEYDEAQVHDAFGRLSSVLRPDPERVYRSDYATSAPLFIASNIVGDALGMRIQAPPDPVDGRDEPLTLQNIVRASGIRVREVTLREDWWKRDNGPILGYWSENKQPVALIPDTVQRYLVHDPVTDKRQRVTAALASRLSPYGFTFYRTLKNEPLALRDLTQFGFWAMRRDLATVAFMGICGGLLGMLIPLITGRIFDVVVPSADRSALAEFSLILLSAAFATVLFQVVRSIAILRIEMKVDGSLQAAIWDRLLNLPTPFFRHYSAGDLSLRAMGISTIRRAVSGTVVSAVLGSTFSLFNFFLLFYFNGRLALIATFLVFASIAITLISGYRQLRYQRELADVQGSISGLVLQLITGISKLRIAGVENRAFSQWARRFTAQKQLSFKVGNIENLLTVFNATYPITTSIFIFAMVATTQNLSTGIFLAFNAAFTQFLFAGLDLSNGFVALLRIVPNYERMKPILRTVPEVDVTKSDPGELMGEIEVNRVSFRYKEDGPLILRDVSFQVRPGDFIALVGPSGSGKSTLLRLLLGFEKPSSGGIFFDGQDLSGLDIRSVRQQLGVVLQNSQLMTGDIFNNIVGAAPLTMDHAWEAAAMAGLDTDIKQMPMGMHTIVSEGGSTLSGGQRQRLLIARAIAKKPKILFFDEATSALDNRTQAIVSESLESLDATRIVIAHRLSTIIHADRILVMSNGSIVQSGTYDELIRQKGVFADLARRQLV